MDIAIGMDSRCRVRYIEVKERWETELRFKEKVQIGRPASSKLGIET